MKKPCELKFIISYDPRDNTYRVIDHNLDPQDAVERAATMRKQSVPAFAVEQTTHHRAPEAQQCPACRRDVKKTFAGWGITPKEKKQND